MVELPQWLLVPLFLGCQARLWRALGVELCFLYRVRPQGED